MVIGIDGSRAFLKQRTGIEEYSYQLIKHLTQEISEDIKVRLYIQKQQEEIAKNLVLPKNWEVRPLWAPRFWTKIRLSLEMLLCRPDVLLVPAHTLPLIGARKNIVVIHGLEYELCKESYSIWERLYMRLSIRHSCRKSARIIAVSESTKKDLQKLYNVSEEKITVIYEGYTQGKKNQREKLPHILFIGRLEERKNIVRIIEAFEILKKRYHISEKLVLVGRPGFGYEKINSRIQNSEYKQDIQELGFVSREQKELLLSKAKVFIFPSLYEGFGLPILEAQAAGVPVVTSSVSSLPEVAGEGALYVDPYNAEDIAQKLYQVLVMSLEERQALIQKGVTNKDRFSWEECAREVRGELIGSVI